MPCNAKHLLSWVLSITPGNFLAEKTWNGSEKTEARTGAVPWLMTGAPLVVSEDCVPTSTKLIFSLGDWVSDCLAMIRREDLPEGALGPNAQILQNEPYADLVVGICQAECTSAEAADQIASEHPARPSGDGLGSWRHGCWGLAAGVVLWGIGDGLAVLIRVCHLLTAVVIVHLWVAHRVLALAVAPVGGGHALRWGRI